MPESRASLDDARRFLAALARPGDVFELRALAKVNGHPQITSGYFDDVEALARAACDRSGKDDGVYVTINPTHPGLLARKQKNRVHRAGNSETTSDKDVAARRTILVDVDPIRPAGISSTDEEHAQSIDLARRVRDDLSHLGWPSPILADSGNGAHLIYAVDLPVADGDLVRRVLAKLSTSYSSSTIKVDERVYNPARISKVYGTLTRKGENTTERPHRIARILEMPETLATVPREVLEAYAPVAAPTRSSNDRPAPPRSSRDRFVAPPRELDITAWLADHLPDAKERPWTEGKKWILPVCPFNDAHDRGEAYVCQMHSGALAAGCQHESCRWGWADLRERYEPAADRRRANGANGHEDRRLTDRVPPPETSREVIYQDEDYREIEAFAERDREPAPSLKPHPKWRRGPDLVAEIWARKDDPWIELKLVDERLARVRAGGIAVVMGGSGSGKSSLVSNLVVEHAKNAGPAIVLSIELPADELGARIVGIRKDASWEDVLTGAVRRDWMEDALNLPRLYVLDRKDASLENLRACVDEVRKHYPGEPILAALDYAQLAPSKEREARQRVADVFAQIDDVARDTRIAMIAVSQMGRVQAKQAREGERIGADSADLGAESAAVERFATVTITIGKAGESREDGSREVELSIGKARMGDGDRVVPMSYWGRSGLWRVAGEAKTASQIRLERGAEKEAAAQTSLELQLIGAAQRAAHPIARDTLMGLVEGRKQRKKTAVERLLQTGELVEVARRGPRSKLWLIWTPDRATEAKMPLARDHQVEAFT